MKKSIGLISFEALIAMFIFSFGMLALLGLQASLYARNQDARFRIQAGASANELISVALADATNAACYTVPVNTQQNCAKQEAQNYTKAWVAEITGLLPGTTNYPPKVTLNANGDFTIFLTWQRTQDANPHSYTLTTRLGL